MKLRNDTLHSFFLNALSSTLKKRDVIHGQWAGKKCVCISFDCDFAEDMTSCQPIIQLMKNKSVSASFAIPGWLAMRFNDEIEEMLENNHEIINHTYSHSSEFRTRERNYLKSEIEKLQEFMLKTYNYTPKGFRCPHGLRNIRSDLFDILKENRLYDSSLLGFGVSKVLDVVEIPLSPCPEHGFMAFDSYHHFRFPLFSASEKKMLQLWTLLLKKNSMVNIFLDPIDFASKVRLELLNQMIDSAINSDFTFMRMDKVCSQLFV